MNITRCVECGKDFEYPDGKWANKCALCFPEYELGIPVFDERIRLSTGTQISKSEMNEMLRRRVIWANPKTPGRGDYFVGRKCENGKIAERSPSA